MYVGTTLYAWSHRRVLCVHTQTHTHNVGSIQRLRGFSRWICACCCAIYNLCINACTHVLKKMLWYVVQNMMIIDNIYYIRYIKMKMCQCRYMQAILLLRSLLSTSVWYCMSMYRTEFVPAVVTLLDCCACSPLNHHWTNIGPHELVWNNWNSCNVPCTSSWWVCSHHACNLANFICILMQHDLGTT